MGIVMIALLVTLMLVIIAAGTVAYCVSVGKKAKRAVARSEALTEGQEWLSKRVGELEDKLIDLREKALENASQSATEDENKTEEQYESIQKYQLKDYGLRFGGISTDED